CRCACVPAPCAPPPGHSSHKHFASHLQTYGSPLPISFPSSITATTPSPVPNAHSIPITQRVRRNRQRLPSSLLIENASYSLLDPRTLFCPRHFRSSVATSRPCAGGRLAAAGHMEEIRVYQALESSEL